MGFFFPPISNFSLPLISSRWNQPDYLAIWREKMQPTKCKSSVQRILRPGKGFKVYVALPSLFLLSKLSWEWLDDIIIIHALMADIRLEFPAPWIPLVLLCVASYRLVCSFKIPNSTVLAFKIRIVDCQLSCLPNYIKMSYMQRLYSSFFIFPVHGRHALNLLLFAKHDDGNGILDALSCAEDIWFTVGKVAGDCDVGNHQDQWW